MSTLFFILTGGYGGRSRVFWMIIGARVLFWFGSSCLDYSYYFLFFFFSFYLQVALAGLRALSSFARFTRPSKSIKKKKKKRLVGGLEGMVDLWPRICRFS